MFAEVLGSILASSSIFLTYAMLLVVRTHPWWNAQYFIPMLGMLLGNCISGISVGLTTLLEELTSGARFVYMSIHLGPMSRAGRQASFMLLGSLLTVMFVVLVA